MGVNSPSLLFLQETSMPAPMPVPAYTEGITFTSTDQPLGAYTEGMGTGQTNGLG